MTPARHDRDNQVIKQSPVPATTSDPTARIAGIFEANDKLIENNTRRIGILEEMAQTIHREWFVHFRFPGREKASSTPSPVGPIPQGWDVKRATDAMAVDPPTLVPKEGEKPFVPISGLANDSMLVHGVESRAGNSGSRFKNGEFPVCSHHSMSGKWQNRIRSVPAYR